MKYVVKYTNPNNITNTTYTFETRMKSELNEFLRKAHKYNGSYTILSVDRVSEAKNNSN
jgi:hypothetical protein